jgi:hypothetical protein
MLISPARARAIHVPEDTGAGRFLGVVQEDDKDAEGGYDEEEEHSN